MRKIPRVIISQHPDHAQIPYWNKSAFISSREEIEECYRSFSELGADEYLWDWEGKLVDEAVIERLFHGYYGFFKRRQLGRDVFITFRLPQINARLDYRIGRALFAIKTAESLSQSLELHSPPLIEVILPLVESAAEMLKVHQAHRELQGLDHRLFNLNPGQNSQIGVIPIFEKVETLFKVKQILKDYLIGYKKQYGEFPEYVRPFSARSDPALNSGLIPAVIANKIALGQYYQLSGEMSIPVYPIIGPGALPFRGHLTPDRTKEFLEEYPGVYTLVVQGAFRYDWEIKKVKQAIKFVNGLKTDCVRETGLSIQKAWDLCNMSTGPYRATIEKLAPEINRLAAYLPARRERMMHIGLFGYSRGVGEVTLPRAISFTAALYSLGAPPEIIGTGRALRRMAKLGLLKELKKIYSHLDEDLKAAMAFYHEPTVKLLSQINPAWKEVMTDAKLVKEFLKSEGEYIIQEKHGQVVEQIASQFVNKNKDGELLTNYLEQAGVLRRSLG